MNKESEISFDEQEALAYAKRMKEFYEFLATYLLLAAVFLVAFWGEWIVYLIFAGLGVCLLIQGLLAFEVIGFLSPNWERKFAEKRLGRKL